METSVQKILNNPEFPDNYKYYWSYQYRLGDEIVVPYLKKLRAFNEGMNVAEIGSAEGGVLFACAENGSKFNLATDIAENRLDMGRKMSENLNLNVEFCYHDIINQEPHPEWVEKFDLIILRDVIEHLDDTEIALRNIKKLLKQGGFLYVTFPPYHSPFGGHQHTVMNTLGKIPYIHLLPDFIFHKMIASGRENDIGEVKRLQSIRLTSKKFVRAATQSGYEVFHEDFYLLRPVFKMKFGLPSLKLTPIKMLPFVKTFLSLEASYILRKR